MGVEEGSKMKFLATACLVAAAFAEPEAKADADAALLYGGYGYTGLGYAGPGYAGLGYAGLGYTGLGYAGLGYAGLDMLDMDTPMLDMDMGTTLVRGLLMLSLKLMLRLTLLFFMEIMAMLVLVMQDMLVLDMLVMLVLDTGLMLDIPTPMELMLDILISMANKSSLLLSFIQNNNTIGSKKAPDDVIMASRFYSQPVTNFPVLLIEYVGKM